ncbi:sugar ABC transporter ATP-binding protein [Azospirillum thermophilum]|uniref:Lipase n=1 Tax=Azospirillum thermophilum TaxID=2202148 RepID=A0A2S2CYC0_9PROT|nr:sugar ABC transporter ATP-binding protein [Azospirillum thermophilum]AWK89513.1 lipase [Azospirillum thermophilum]
MTEPFIELRDIGKRFAGVRALDGVSLALMPGEIHCLAGENGSGKSTIIKVLSGVHQPDDGEILIDGKPVRALSPMESIRHGVQVIYQDFSLFGNLTVAENLATNTILRERRRLVNWTSVRKLARDALDRLGVDLDLDAEVGSLPTAGKQIVAIARALMSDARLLIMDEPTTALTRNEVDALFRIVRDIQRQGIAVLFVSHKMREMLEISERMTVIRNGRKVVEGPTGNFDESSLIRAMTGQDIRDERYVWTPAPGTAAPRLEVRNLSLPGSFEDLTLSLLPGEIVGLSGLLGSGRTEMALALFGLKTGFTGEIRIDGRPVHPKTVQEAIGLGVAYVPEDRLTEGLFLNQSINRNMLASSYETHARLSVIDRDKVADLATGMIGAMHIATPTGEKPVGQLSGGNQQRVVIARWLLTEARILILNGPTVGVDVGSKAEIHRIIRGLARDKGLSVLMISDDVPELVQNCNRIIVMHRGRFVEELEAAATTEEQVADLLKTLR